MRTALINATIYSMIYTTIFYYLYFPHYTPIILLLILILLYILYPTPLAYFSEKDRKWVTSVISLLVLIIFWIYLTPTHDVFVKIIIILSFIV